MKRELGALLILSTTALSFSTCGRRGSPKPPLSFIPAPPKIEDVYQIENRPFIVIKPSYTYSDGRKIPKSLIKREKFLIKINFKRVIETANRCFKDSVKKPNETVCYQVSTLLEGRKSTFTDPSCLSVKKPLFKKPQVVKISVSDSKVSFLFKRHSLKIECFKSQRGRPFPCKPYRVISGNLFVDDRLHNGETYAYKFRFSQDTRKGPFTKVFYETPLDNQAPEPPKNPQLFRLKKNACILVWEPSPSKDVSFYSISWSGGRTKTDKCYAVVPCGASFYKISAVDRYKNFSRPIVWRARNEEKSRGDNGQQVR